MTEIEKLTALRDKLVARRRTLVDDLQRVVPELLKPESIMRDARQTVVHMSSPMVLLRAVDGTREGWCLMTWEDFLEQMDLNAWHAGQELMGMVLPPRTPLVN